MIKLIFKGQLGENIGKTVVEGSTRLGQSEPIKKLEAISEQIDGETSLNSQVSNE